MMVSGLFGTLIYAQKPIHARYEMGIAHTGYSFSNPQGNVRLLNNRQVYYGATLSHRLKKNFHLEVGILSKYYAADLYSTEPDTSNLVLALNRIQIPVRVLYSSHFLTRNLEVSLSAGTSFIIAHSFNGLDYFPASEAWTQIGENPKRIFSLYELGTSVGYEINNFTFGIVYRVFVGFNNQIDYRVTAVRSDDSVTEYSIKSKGNFTALTGFFGYRFGSLDKR